VLLTNVRVIEQINQTGLDVRSFGSVRFISVQQHARASDLQDTPAIQSDQMDRHDQRLS
jgi:hypothetical protein